MRRDRPYVPRQENEVKQKKPSIYNKRSRVEHPIVDVKRAPSPKKITEALGKKENAFAPIRLEGLACNERTMKRLSGTKDIVSEKL